MLPQAAVSAVRMEAVDSVNSAGNERQSLLQIIAPFNFFQQVMDPLGWVVDPFG